MKTALINFSLLSIVLCAACNNDGAAKKPTTESAASASPPAPAPTSAPAAVSAISTAEAATTTSAKMAPTPASVVHDTELKDKPFADAKTLKRLPARTAVTIVDRQGGWLRVQAGNQQGWVRLLHISSQPSGSGGTSADELKSAAKVATGRAGTGNIVSTTGIRGLNEEQLSKAQPNPAELQRLEGYGVSKEQATTYARAQKLERRQVPYLPEPK